jgi:hypothetical protein
MDEVHLDSLTRALFIRSRGTVLAIQRGVPLACRVLQSALSADQTRPGERPFETFHRWLRVRSGWPMLDPPWRSGQRTADRTSARGRSP